MLAVSWLNSQIIFDGIVQGLAIAVIAVGVILVYRATRIINFAVGGMGVVGAVMLALLNLQYHVPFWIAFFLSLLIGVIFGAAVDATIVRRLRRAPKVVVLVATIGVAQLAQVIAVEIPSPSNVTDAVPDPLQRVLDRRRGQRARDRSLGPGAGADRDPGARLVPRPDDRRQDREGVFDQRRAREDSRASTPSGSRPWCGRSRPDCRRSRSSCSPVSRARSAWWPTSGPRPSRAPWPPRSSRA